MQFFNLASKKKAIITKNQSYTYEEIPQVEFSSKQKELVLILCQNTMDILSAYISAMNSEHAIMLLAADVNEQLLADIITTYEPNWLIGLESYSGYMQQGPLLVRQKELEVTIHSDLALLLSTSGTTGSRKFVRLSYENVRSNAESIIKYLNIDVKERAIMNLPLSYSYGMSIVNSHLLAGASILLTDESVIDKTFWSFVKEQKATSLAGVPFTYQMLQRIGITKMDLPYLMTLTQAGGRLNEKLVNYFAQYAIEQEKRFFVMYGQTEAAPRMSYIPIDKTLEKSGSIGIAVPGGKFSIDAETGELIYKGSNVMMGYAESLVDLTKGDELNGVLRTGDTATVDEDGYFTITGRMKRFVKLFGLRINLDDIEKRLESELSIPLACTGADDKLIIAIENAEWSNPIKGVVECFYKLHKTAYKIKVMEQIPRFNNGKIDYITLKERCL